MTNRKALSNLKNSSAGRPNSRHLMLLLCMVLVLFAPPTIFGQGCAQCLDSTRATPPAVQAAYRHAILLMAGVASSLFIAGTLLLRKLR